MAATYDLIIIGGGSAGLTAAGFGVQLGRKVALVEKGRVGGDCTWTGCVPSKTLMRTARVAHEMRHAHRYGLAPVEPVADLRAVMAHVRSVVDQVYQRETPATLQADGINVFMGPTQFLDSHTITVGDTRLTGRRFLIVTGASPFIPPIAGLEGVGYLTYETVWDLERLPERLVVVGGGPVGCELAQAFGRLGSRVTLVEGGPRILPQDEPEASQVIARQLGIEGIDLRLGDMVERVWRDRDGIHVAAGGREAAGDALLLAVGRRPRVAGLGLEKAGVAYSSQGVQVNEHLRTSQRHIYAAGDCIGGYQFTHYAGWQGFMAVRNAFLPGNARAVLDRVPWATFTDPEVARVGLSEGQARERFGDGVKVCHWPMEWVDRALAEVDTSGFIKVVYRGDGKLLGATIVAARAGEMVHEWSVAIDRGLKIGDLARSIHVYPTYSTASMQAAAQVRVGHLLSGASGKVIRGLARLAR